MLKVSTNTQYLSPNTPTLDSFLDSFADLSIIGRLVAYSLQTISVFSFSGQNTAILLHSKSEHRLHLSK